MSLFYCYIFICIFRFYGLEGQLMASVTLSVNIAMYYANTLWLQLEQVWRVAKMYLMNSCVQLKIGGSPGWRLSEMLTNTSLKNKKFRESNTGSRIWTNGVARTGIICLRTGTGF